MTTTLASPTDQNVPADPFRPTYYLDRDPVTAATASFRFYDVESLGNVFTTSIYCPDGFDPAEMNYLANTDANWARTRVSAPFVAVFLLVDRLGDGTPFTLDMIDEAAFSARVIADNPALTALSADAGVEPVIRLFNLATTTNIDIMAWMLGGICDIRTRGEQLGSGDGIDNLHRVTTPSRPDWPKVDRHHYARRGLPMIGENEVRCVPEFLYPVTDTDPTYSPETTHPFIVGYNSANYDTSILAIYFAAHYNGTAPDAWTMRSYNNRLFEEEYSGDDNDSGFSRSMTSYLYNTRDFNLAAPEGAADIRQSMIKSGRAVDISKLNETQKFVGLKRLLGQLGHQIMESDTDLSGDYPEINSVDELVDLLVYNVSDIVGTRLLFDDNLYSGAFDLRASLLHRYPETVFARDNTVLPTNDPNVPWVSVPDYTRPRIAAWSVRNDRLNVDSTSAGFVDIALAPYRALVDIPGHLGDLPVVSLRYPAVSRVDTLGIPRTNVLTDLRNWYHENITDPDTLAAFANVYAYYRDIEGCNVDDRMDRVGADPVADLRQIVATLDTIAPDRLAGVANAVNVLKTINSWNPLNRGEFTETMITGVITDIVTKLSDGSFPDIVSTEGSDPDIIPRLTGFLMFYQAQFDSHLPFDPADDPTPDTPATEVYPPEQITVNVKKIAERPSNLIYVSDAEGTPTSCFATFSTGGIHGAEMNLEKFASEVTDIEEAWRLYADALAQVNDEIDATIEAFNAGQSFATTRTSGKRVIEVDLIARLHDATTFANISAGLNDLVPPTKDFPVTKTEPVTVDQVPGRAPVTYTAHRAAMIAWWIRSNLRVTVVERGVPDPASVIVEHKDLVDPKFKTDNPHLRKTPTGVRSNAQKSPFSPADTDRIPEYPEGAVHDNTKLSDAYAMTSVDDVAHEDFTSYYPRLLSNMATFDNPDLGGDRYTELYHDKQRYADMLAQPGLTADEKAKLKIARAGVKLLLNAASGRGDAGFDSNIRANNAVVSMRMIGQVFAFIIAQDQSLLRNTVTGIGGRITSTNTDGVYIAGLDPETIETSLSRWADKIGVDIEPEPMTLVTKDANNRAEYLTAADSAAAIARKTGRDIDDIKPWERVLLTASGGQLAAADGPSAGKSLAHAAISDYVFTRYFPYVAGGAVSGVDVPSDPDRIPDGKTLSITDPMNQALVRSIIDGLMAEHADDPAKLLTFFQHIVAGNPSKKTYLFTTNSDDAVESDTHRLNPGQVTAQQRYNRIFYVDPTRYHDLFDARLRNTCSPDHPVRGFVPSPVSTLARAKARPINATRRESIAKGSQKIISHAAKKILTDNGEEVMSLMTSNDYELVTESYAGVDSTAPVVIANQALHFMDIIDQTGPHDLVSTLDLDRYTTIIASIYDENWRNS